MGKRHMPVEQHNDIARMEARICTSCQLAKCSEYSMSCGWRRYRNDTKRSKSYYGKVLNQDVAGISESSPAAVAARDCYA